MAMLAVDVRGSGRARALLVGEFSRVAARPVDVYLDDVTTEIVPGRIEVLPLAADDRGVEVGD